MLTCHNTKMEVERERERENFAIKNLIGIYWIFW